MRVNVYTQELTDECVIVNKVAETGVSYYGLRIFLRSPDTLHHTPDDDDRSAITFWLPGTDESRFTDLVHLFRRAANLILGQ